MTPSGFQFHERIDPEEDRLAFLAAGERAQRRMRDDPVSHQLADLLNAKPEWCIGYQCWQEAAHGPYCPECYERARRRAARLGIDIMPRQEQEEDVREPAPDTWWLIWRVACWVTLLVGVGLVLTACLILRDVRPTTVFLIVSMVGLAWSMYRTRTGKEKAVREIEEPPTRLTIREGLEADRVNMRTVLLYAACAAVGFVGAAWLIAHAPWLFPVWVAP